MKHLNLLISGLLVLSIGLFSGYAMGYFQAKSAQFPQIQMVDELNSNVSTIHLLNVADGVLHGQVAGQAARIAHHTEAIQTVQAGETFQIPLADVDLASFYSAEDLPENTAFIASKSGKYYYSILDPRALRITPKNRRYFQSDLEAEAAGYQARQ